MKKGEPSRIIKLILVMLIPMIYYWILTVNVFAYGIDEDTEKTSSVMSRIENGEAYREIIDNSFVANIYVDAYSMQLNNIFVGYLANEEDGEKVIKAIEKKYVNKLGNNATNIQSVDTTANMSLEKKSIRLGDISSVEEVVDNIVILNKSKEDPLVEVEIIAVNNELVDIDPPTKIVHNNDIYIGESQVENGTSGKKEVTKKDVFVNGKLQTYDVIGEKILIKPTESIVYRGTKNPIMSGVMFLENPTRGGVVTSDFGNRAGGKHSGLDIGAPTGTPIGAACDGVVTYVGYNGAYGNMVIVKHSDNIETIYAHASEILITVGKQVKKGEVIAKVGSTGRSTGPHLHFELRSNGEPINPKNFINNL